MKKILLVNVLLVFFVMESKSQFSHDSLSTFLIKAKIESYASGDESKIVKCEEGCNQISYFKDNFRYRDRYFGENNFSGEEIVWWNNKVVWSMNYFGFTSTSVKIPDGFPGFLKTALRNIDKNYPFRGPKTFKVNDFEYINSIHGDLKDFSGVEKIIYKGIEIYKLYYHGGEILY